MADQTYPINVFDPRFLRPQPQFVDYTIEPQYHWGDFRSPTHYEEELHVLSSYSYPTDQEIEDPGFEVKRELNAHGIPEEKAPLNVSNRWLHWEKDRGGYTRWGQSWLAFWGKAPRSVRARQPNDVLNQRESQYVHSLMAQTIETTAQFYADRLSAALLYTPEDVEVRKTMAVSADGTVTPELSIFFRNSEVEDGRQYYRNWELAQECGKFVEEYKARQQVALLLETNSHQASRCFEIKWLFLNPAGGIFEINESKKLFDSSLVGKPKPANPVGVGRISISDKGMDGSTDEVRANFEGTNGQFEVPVLSSYTYSTLAYFDHFFAEAEPTHFRFELPQTPPTIFVKPEQCFLAGDPLFMATMEGPTVTTVRAEADGCVDYMSEPDTKGQWVLGLRP